MNRIGFYCMIFMVWATGALVFTVYKTKTPDPVVQYEVTEAQKNEQRALERKIEILEQKVKDNNAELEKSRSAGDGSKNAGKPGKRSARKDEFRLL